MKKLKVVDLSTLLPGPFASHLLLKYLDCTVLKIEDLNQPDPLINLRPTKDGVSLGYQAINSDKQLHKIDFRADGLDTINKEVKDAHIFIHNFKSTRAYKLGLAYDDLVKLNPNIIYCSITGFAPDSPLGKKSAHDLNILALSGYLDQQAKLTSSIFLPPLPLADIYTAYHAALKISAAIINQTTPYHLNISMYEAFLEAMTLNNSPQLITHKDFSPEANPMSGHFPCYGVYPAKSGGQVAVAALEKPLWIDFCSHLNRPDLIEKQFEPEAASDVALELNKIERDSWLAEELDFCVTPVLSINEAAHLHYV